MKFVPFFFDGNRWFGKVTCSEEWFSLLATYDLEQVLTSKMAPQLELDELPPEYHFGAMEVRKEFLPMPSFGHRREHAPGTVSLEEWAKNRGMNLRNLSKQKPEA